MGGEGGVGGVRDTSEVGGTCLGTLYRCDESDRCLEGR